MLKLPKGLKKKKKKSKKDQELFTEEELEQYKREQRLKQEAQEQQQSQKDATAAGESDAAVSDSEVAADSGAAAAPAEDAAKASGEDDEEWNKFKLLTAGVDSVLHKTQDGLDRIKQTSFYQRLPTEAEKKKLEEEEAAAREAERLEKERLEAEEREANRDKLAEAVVELSDSEEESEEVDDIFNTGYIDAITSGEVQLTVVESPVLEFDEGPDPFDTAYAEKVIVGSDKAKTGKKLVALGAAVEVLTGRVDRDHALALSGAKKRARKGIVNLLGEDEDVPPVIDEDLLPVTPEPPKSLLDDLVDDLFDVPDAPIDLSVSLHLQFAPKKEDQEKSEASTEGESDAADRPIADILSEFDVLKKEDDDEFAELAAESLNKKDEVLVIKNPQQLNAVATVAGNWAEFEQEPESKKAKPPRPPPPGRPATGPHIPAVTVESDDEFAVDGDDPFDTTFVEQVIVAKEDDDDDFDFDPRADEPKPATTLSVTQKDLLAGSTTDLSAVGQSPIAPVKDEEPDSADFDPFDTSSVANIVQPKSTELKFLEKELLDGADLKRSLSDPDFDPRADEPEPPAVKTSAQDTASRKSSLCLHIPSKTVGFSVPEVDLLAVGNDAGKSQKPLTPYYAPVESIEENEDPFDTSFVPEAKPSQVELKNLEEDLLASSLKHSLSDPDFDPRAAEPTPPPSDLLAVDNQINIKVLTPAQESKDIAAELEEVVDPFDTSIAANLGPGKTELKLLESEFVPAKTPEFTTVLDTLTDAQELGLGDKVLTPQITLDETTEDIDPFDTTFADNLGPGKAEIKVLENELIEN